MIPLRQSKNDSHRKEDRIWHLWITGPFAEKTGS